jgi:hypothetical protein
MARWASRLNGRTGVIDEYGRKLSAASTGIGFLDTFSFSFVYGHTVSYLLDKKKAGRGTIVRTSDMASCFDGDAVPSSLILMMKNHVPCV